MGPSEVNGLNKDTEQFARTGLISLKITQKDLLQI